MESVLNTTNAIKLFVATAFNAVVTMLASFGVSPLTDEQTASVLGCANLVIFGYALFTYKRSHKRLPEGITKEVVEEIVAS